jgi:hypothetical protein
MWNHMMGHSRMVKWKFDSLPSTLLFVCSHPTGTVGLLPEKFDSSNRYRTVLLGDFIRQMSGPDCGLRRTWTTSKESIVLED